jgi:hypothetical protein
MNVYVVVTKYMHGIQDEAIFSSLEKAQAYLGRCSEGSPEILSHQVRGNLVETDKVFTASTYDRIYDIHNVYGVYGTYEDAMAAAGEKGSFLKRGIDDRQG